VSDTDGCVGFKDLEGEAMLILSRRVGERVEIGGGVTVVVTAVRGEQVQLGFECPRDIPIRRPEARTMSRPEAEPMRRPEAEKLEASARQGAQQLVAVA
jgi:carbon storage regulator CsrA